jgi:replicative superfamily II helicase
MNNAVYGKTMENVRLRMDMELVTNAKRLKKCIASPFFKDRTIYSETLCAVHYHKKKVYMNKPIYVGMCILDLSKTLMYEFHYDFMLKKYGKKLSLLYMDTDSFFYHIKTEDFYQDIRMNPNESPADYPFDTSDYPKDQPCYSALNKKVLGTFKDEANSVPATHFEGLRAKMYAMKYGGKVTKRAKGVKRGALKKQITFEDYGSCLRTADVKYTNFRTFRSHKHHVFTIQQSKLSLSSHDDKRYILPDKVNTLPHEHYMISQLKAETLVEIRTAQDTSQHVEMVEV